MSPLDHQVGKVPCQVLRLAMVHKLFRDGRGKLLPPVPGKREAK